VRTGQTSSTGSRVSRALTCRARQRASPGSCAASAVPRATSADSSYTRWRDFSRFIVYPLTLSPSTPSGATSRPVSSSRCTSSRLSRHTPIPSAIRAMRLWPSAIGRKYAPAFSESAAGRDGLTLPRWTYSG
jgi:hypothetical protein